MFFKKKPTYIIYSWPYSEEVGGFIALHSLCDQLRKAGRKAYIWPAGLTLSPQFRLKRAWLQALNGHRSPLNVQFRLNPTFDTSVAAPEDLSDAIVVYPEVVAGNPLNAKKIVRWLLNKPGRLTGNIQYTDDELYFFYQEAFNDPDLNPHPENKLQIVTIFEDTFRQTKPLEGRSGTCYILRKGKNRAPDAHKLDGPVIDNLPHQKIAEIFNNHEYCVSYDMHTMYSVYAAMCGCKSIVQPEPGLPKNEWQPSVELTYGIAYGHDDLEWAKKTKGLMTEYHHQIQATNLKSVEAFANKCEAHFKK